VSRFAPAVSPPVAQQLEQLRRQHGIAVLAALALLDPQQHALGIDIADLERDDLEDAQSGATCGSAALYFGPGAACSRA
jgi:hypothetical protein